MIIQWLEEAVYDLQSIRHYIDQDNSVAASSVVKKILDKVALLSEQPEMGRQGRVLHTRELVISNTPYIVPYRVKDRIVQILRVFHCAMQWPETF